MRDFVPLATQPSLPDLRLFEGIWVRLPAKQGTARQLLFCLVREKESEKAEVLFFFYCLPYGAFLEGVNALKEECALALCVPE